MNDRFRIRAWHEPTQKMFEVHCFTAEQVFENTLDGVGTSPTNPANTNDCVLMQCTGLKDMTGRLIYEGDVVALNDDEIAVISWSDVIARFVIENEDVQADFDNFYPYELEIVGNIYENPQLLGDE